MESELLINSNMQITEPFIVCGWDCASEPKIYHIIYVFICFTITIKLPRLC